MCSKLPGCKKKRTSFWCEECRKPLCISNCFEIFHTELNYKEKATEIIQNSNLANLCMKFVSLCLLSLEC